MSLKGKKIACFLALPHHTRFFIPLREEIKRQGGEILFIVTLSEYPYELDLAKRKLSYRLFTDYLTEEVRRKIHDSTLTLMDSWAKMCFKWDGFSRWPIYKQSWFFEAVVEEYFCIERFMEVEKPDMFIIHHECNRWGQTIGHLCYKYSIPFVTFQEGDYHGDYIGFVVHTHYSIANLLWGEKTKKVLKSYRCSADKMISIGNTHIESAVKTYSNPKMIADIKREIAVPPDKKVILFLVDIKYGGITKEDEWRRFLQGLDRLEESAVCIFKWHPSVLKRSYQQIQEMFRELYPSAILLDTYEPYKLLAIADCCITMGKTTLAIESLAFGKPLFSFPTPDTFEDYYVSIGVAQTVFPPGNWQNLFNTMEHGVPAHIQENVDRYMEKYFYKLDGKSIDRAAEIMGYILDVRKERKRDMVSAGKRFIKERVSFIIPSGEDAEALLATLTSLTQNVKYSDWEVILVANSEAVQNMLAGLSGDLKVINERSNSLAVLYNKGAEASSGEYLIFMRPGIVYFKDEGIVKAMKDGIVGVPIKNSDMTPYCLGSGYDFNFTPYRITDESKQPDAVGGGFISMKRDIFEKVNGFDEEIANHLIEPDICLEAKELNMPVIYLSNCLGFNYKETFFGNDVSDENWKNRMKFFAKWVGKLPGDEDFLNFAKDLLKV